MAHLLPAYSLDADLVFNQIEQLIKIIHNAGGHLFLVQPDDLQAYQKHLHLFHGQYGSQCMFTINHPISTSVFSKLYLLHDPTHLFKNVLTNSLNSSRK